MNKKSFFVILGLSVVTTYILGFVDFVFNITTGEIGLPFGFSTFNFLGSSTDSKMLVLDVIFWFVVIWGIWKLLKKALSKKTH